MLHFMRNMLSTVMAPGSCRQLKSTKWKIYVFIGVAMSVFQIWSVIFSKMEPIIQMSTHLSFILVLTFLLFTHSKKTHGGRISVMIDMIFIVLSAACGVYFWMNAGNIATRIVGVDPLTGPDILFGLLFVLLSVEAARRTIGFGIIAVAFLFILYALYGHLLDGIWYHREMPFVELLDQLAFSLNGLWGSPISVAASFVFMFVLFGTFLQVSGAGTFFFDLSRALAGRSRGGAAKIAVIASALMGTISGSPTANVVTTGSFTIPMAKKLGYSARFAAAIEACASTGGSFLPPIMGSSAFLMAAVTGIPYTYIAVAAILPALLYYVSLFSVVHFEAVRLDLPRVESKDIPNVKQVLRSGWFHFIPLIMLVIFLLQGLSPSRAGVFGILSIIVVSWVFNRKARMNVKKIAQAMVDGAKSAIPISTACAVAGIVIAGIMTTGLGGKLNSIILGITAGQLFPSLLLIMAMCIILGMGMPVAAAYVLTAMLAAPALINLGVSEMGAHLFIVYFSIISAITPPVAVAAFAAAGIAGASPTKVGFDAVRLGLASFIVPFAFIFNPALLMDGTFLEILYAVIASALGVVVIGCGIVGYFHKKVHFAVRLLLIAAGAVMLYPEVLLNCIGLLVTAGIYVMNHESLNKLHLSGK